MAEVTALRNNALPYPIYAESWTVVLPILDADGDPVTSAAGLDSERSINGDTMADCTNEATEIGDGLYYLTLTAAELTCDVLGGLVKTSTAGAKNTPFTLYPRKLVKVRTGTTAAGAAATVTLDAGASAVDDYYNGMVVAVYIDATATEQRVITDYAGSTKVATVHAAWVTANPDADDTFTVYLPEGQYSVQTGDSYARIGAAGASLTALVVDVTKVNGSAAAAARLALSAGQMIPGTVNDTNTAPSATVFAAADITEATADHFKSRIVLWTTGALTGQVTDVTAYALDTGEGKFTVTAMTDTPADGDTFILI